MSLNDDHVKHGPHLEKLLGITNVYFNGQLLAPQEYTLQGKRTILLHFPEPTRKAYTIKPPWWAFWRKPVYVPAAPRKNVVQASVEGTDQLALMTNVFYQGYPKS